MPPTSIHGQSVELPPRNRRQREKGGQLSERRRPNTTVSDGTRRRASGGPNTYSPQHPIRWMGGEAKTFFLPDHNVRRFGSCTVRRRHSRFVSKILRGGNLVIPEARIVSGVFAVDALRVARSSDLVEIVRERPLMPPSSLLLRLCSVVSLLPEVVSNRNSFRKEKSAIRVTVASDGGYLRFIHKLNENVALGEKQE